LITELQSPTDKNGIAVTAAVTPAAPRILVAPRRHVARRLEFRAPILGEKRLGSGKMAASLAVHALVVASLAGIGLYAAGAAPPLPERIVVDFYQPRAAVAPRLPSADTHVKESRRVAPNEAVLRVPPPPHPAPSRPETREAVPVPPRPEPVAERVPEATPEKIEAPELPKPVVRTGAFDAQAPAREPAATPEREMRPGAFDSLMDASARGGRGVPLRAGASVGAFDAEPGPAAGGRFGRGAGQEGTVVRAGFDGAPPARAASASARPAGTETRPSGFADSSPVAAAPRPRLVETLAPDRPVEILSKPKPAYTEEGRRLRVEGDVVLEVLFGAVGSVRVLRVVHGLGHGLDEAAIEAAGRISFRPATRDGVPVDHTATLRVVFQLAY
jgi:TonB family protein